MTSEFTSAVEATSLSVLTDIAANPPEAWNSPVDVPGEPLVLYIARVPGRRDVFLTPLKPREKVVTAEDVQSSLYYVHIHGDEDAMLDISPNISTDRDSMFSDGPTDAPESLPALPARPIQVTAPPLPARPIRNLGTPGLMGARPMFAPSSQATAPAPAQQSNVIKRKPVKPAGQSGNDGSVGLPMLPSLPPRPLPALPRDENVPPSWSKVQPLSGLEDHDHVLNAGYGHGPGPQTGSVTLIRRDPASSEQWNVATITEAEDKEIGIDDLSNLRGPKRARKAGAPLHLHMTSVGYNKFNYESFGGPHSPRSHGREPRSEGGFARTLRLATSGTSHDHLGRDHTFSENDSVHSQAGSKFQKFKRHSAQIGAAFSKNSAASNPKGNYTFHSPWNSLCEFTTPAVGNALRCRQYVSEGDAREPLELSELRFNLPSKPQQRAPNNPSAYSSSTHNAHQRINSIHSWEDGSGVSSFVFNEGKLDLTLGREKAGGGSGGKQAKLGKLIIYPEGVKMLDLLVAANVALWWRAYEKF